MVAHSEGDPETRPTPRETHSRRAGVLVAALIVLAWIHLAVVGAVVGAGDDVRVSAWKLEALHAHAAAEGAARIAIRLQAEDPANPATNFIEMPSGVRATILDPFEAAPESPGSIIVEAAFGESVQRCEWTLERQP